MRKSKALARRRAELESGAPRALGVTLADAVERFFLDRPQLRELTRALYRLHAKPFFHGRLHKELQAAMTWFAPI